MAEVYIFNDNRGPGYKTTISSSNLTVGGSKPPGKLTLEHGQYVFLEEVKVNNTFTSRLVTYNGKVDTRQRLGWRYVTSNGSGNFMGYPVMNRTSRTPFPGGGKYLQHISSFNKSKYGSANAHGPSGGTYYTIRKPVWVYENNKTKKVQLKKGDRVIIGGLSPHGSTGSKNRIRMWGYKRGNKIVETNNCYISSGHQQGRPGNYHINTQ